MVTRGGGGDEHAVLNEKLDINERTGSARNKNADGEKLVSHSLDPEYVSASSYVED